MRAKWRKKPIDVKAERYDSENIHNVVKLLMHSEGAWELKADRTEVPTLTVETIDGNHVNVPYGNYVCLDSKRFAYPHEPEMFEANHERTSEVKQR